MGNAIRRGLQAAQTEVTTYRPVRGPQAISRRQALTRMGAGLTALGATRQWGRPLVREFFVPKTKQLVAFAFLRHQERSDAEQLREHMERARQQCKPYHALAMEGFAVHERRTRIEQRMNQWIDEIRAEWARNPDHGSRTLEDSAYHWISEHVQTEFGPHAKDGLDTTPFVAQNAVLCARYGLRFKILESYSPKEFAQVEKLQSRLFVADAREETLKKRVKTERFTPESVKQIQAELRNAVDEYMHAIAEDIRVRNRFIARQLGQMQNELARENPGLKNTPVRVLAAVGYHHRTLHNEAVTRYPPAFESEYLFANETDPQGAFRTRNQWIRLLIEKPGLKVPPRVLQKIVDEQYGFHPLP